MKEYIVHEPPEFIGAIEQYTTFYGEPIIELIRCKNCKTFRPDNYLIDTEYKRGYGNCLVLVMKGAEYAETIVHELHYCGWAERKEE